MYTIVICEPNFYPLTRLRLHAHTSMLVACTHVHACCMHTRPCLHAHMLSPSAVQGHISDRKDQKVMHAITLGCWRTSRWQKRPESDACHHLGLLEDLAVTEKTRKWCMLSPSAVKGHHGDRKDQKVMHAVTIDYGRTSR